MSGDFSPDFSPDFNQWVTPPVRPALTIAPPVVVPTTPYPGATHKVKVGGTPVVAIYSNMAGGIIQNPASAADQGIAAAEPLFVNFAGDATLGQIGSTIELDLGESVTVPPGDARDVSVNAATSGHLFSCVVFQPQTQYPPTPQGGSFPPPSPTGMTSVIPSYLYQEYSDDEDLQAFFDAYNGQAQSYIAAFNALNLPIYTNHVISGALLDWVGRGLYGVPRPYLSSAQLRTVGRLNTYQMNTLRPNESRTTVLNGSVNSSDDAYKRVITWGFFKGDGKYIGVRWLKRRIARFLFGADGANFPVSSTYQISISFGVGNVVSITLLTRVTTLVRSARLNTSRMNTTRMNYSSIQLSPLTPLPNAQLWKEAVQSGVCEMPFQYTYTIVT